MTGDESSDEDSNGVTIDVPPAKIEVPFPISGSMFGLPISEQLYKRLSEEVVPIVEENGITFGEEYLDRNDIRDIAAYFLITHGLIEDESAYILEYDFGGNRTNAGHSNNIDQLKQKGIIDSSFRYKMKDAYKSRKATHHGFDEMLDQLSGDFSYKVDCMWEVRKEIHNLLVERVEEYTSKQKSDE